MKYTMVIFGASGDLTSRKLIPALYQLYRKKRLPAGTQILGFARTPWEIDAWRNSLAETCRKFLREAFDESTWGEFAQNIHYQPGDIDQPASFISLRSRLEEIEGDAPSTRIYYLSTAPKLYEKTILNLSASELLSETAEKCKNCRRVIIEKPFGTDFGSAVALNDSIHAVLDESQIYRIDHYLGKETVNNVLVLRFANAIFEPIWNRNYVEHIQITANEEVTVGRRAGFYETAGILRDMFQNHLLQILTFVTMEAPARFDAKAVRDEKLKVLQSVRRMDANEIFRNTFRGQYLGYQNEPGVAPGSRTATYGAVMLNIDNWRWKDVPIYLRSGKGMSCRTTQILVQFRRPPHSMFQNCSRISNDANRLLIQIQPDEGIRMYFLTKVPDTDMEMRMTDLSFNFKESYRGELPEAYERLLLDAFHGDASLFARNDEVEEAWKIIDPIQQVWGSQDSGNPEPYEVGTWGPDGAESWMRSLFGHEWFDLCPLV